MISTGETTGSSPTMIISRRRFPSLILLLALPLLIAAKAKKPEEPVIYSEGFLKVVSRDKVSQEQCRKAAKMVRAAWDFDLSVMRWSNPKAINGPLTLRLMSNESMKKEYSGNTRASASPNGKRFTMRVNLVDAKSGPLTIAHELGHVQMFRVLGGKGRKSVPLYFVEGHGLMMNALYQDRLGIPHSKNGDDDVWCLMSLPANDARAIFANSAKYSKKGPDEDNKMHCAGKYFVEYMRTRFHGKGIRDTVPKMGRVFELVARGKEYKDAFKHVYGVSADQVASEIVALFERTKANPVERFKGTRFEADAKIVAEKSRKKRGAKQH